MKQATILIVDDNPTNLRVLLDYLCDSGFKMLVARNGEGALRQAKYANPDIILLDVMMPGIDGYETCRQLKADETLQDIPVIFMTALSETENKLQGFEAGGVDYIIKPLQQEEVLARLNAHLTIRRLQQQLQEQNALLQEKNSQLQELNASKDKFFSIISHDLRSPFQVLLSLTQLLGDHLEMYSQEKIRTSVGHMRTSAEKLYALLENLLTWSRIQRGMMDYQPQHINVSSIIAQNVNLFIVNAEQKQITLSNSVQEELIVYADDNMVDAIIRNLISNALKFTHAGGNIIVSATHNEKDVQTAVADTGTGMNAETIAKLFRLDVKYQGVGTAGEKGTGLGLNLCKDLVEKNGGAIWVESEIEKGSTFTFTLPQNPEKPEERS